jgi:hypothetical protein
MSRVFTLYRTTCLAVASIVAVTSSAGWACSFGDTIRTKDQIAVEAAKAYERASLVIDAEVVAPMATGVSPGSVPAAMLRVIKIWKGKAGNEVTVVYLSSCDIMLDQRGQKMRILLEGDDVYRASQSMNWGIGGDQADFNAAIDRLIGSARPVTFRDPGSIEERPTSE